MRSDGAERGFTAMVLAGGLGTRLSSVLADQPKVLAPVGDEPFLARVLDQLAGSGCTRAILCTGHLGEQVERTCRGGHAGMEVVCSREPRPLGTAGALRHALGLLGGERHVLAVNGDSYCDLDLAGFVAAARAHGAALVAVDVPDAARYGRVVPGADGRVAAFTEKGAGGPGTIHAGLLWLPRAAIAALPHGVPVSLEHDVLPGLVANGLHAHRTAAPFLDVGVPADLARAEAFFAACAARRARPRQALLVVDRDGTLIEDRPYLADPAAVALLPGVVDGLRAFAAAGYDVAVVTNQSGIGRGYFDERALAAVHAELERQLAAHGITLGGIWHCPHAPGERCACRKPEPALLERALRDLGYGPSQCLVVGDRRCDVELGQRVGARTALVRTGDGLGTERDGACAPDLVVDSLAQLAAHEVAR
jgi:histidinol-phosphate phosphatase family protein